VFDNEIPLRTAKDLIDKVNLDINSIDFLLDAVSNFALKKFEINPSDFLSYAKQDLQQGDNRGLVNALSNTKRAIDAEIDRVLNCFGLYSRKLHFPQKIERIGLMGFVAPKILSKIVSSRNYLEHEYKIPDMEQVEDFIDVAELFIYSIENVLYIFPESFFIMNLLPEEHSLYNPSIDLNEAKTIHIELNQEHKQYELTGWIFDPSGDQYWNGRPGKYIGKAILPNKDRGYMHLISLASCIKIDTHPQTIAEHYQTLIKSI
jgi:hypothetical protein